MSNTSNVPLNVLYDKIRELDRQIERASKKKEHILYVIDNFSSGNPSQLDFKDPTKDLDGSLNTKPLIIQILKNEGNPLHWKEVHDRFVKVKTNKITIDTFKVSITDMAKKPKFPIKRTKPGVYSYSK